MRRSAFSLCLWLAMGLSTAAAARAALPSLLIEDLTWPEVQRAIAGGASTAIYYAGSTEQNGPHMVIGKHNFIAHRVAQRIAEALGNALVYPVMPFAPTGDALAKTGHMRYPGSVSVSDATYAAVCRDVVLSAIAAGFTNVVVMGDHGGGQDALKKTADDLDLAWAPKGQRVFYIGDLYFKSQEAVRELLAKQRLSGGEHASLVDTSELMALDRQAKWIRRDQLAAGDAKSGVEGDPRKASVELGRQFIEFKVMSAVAQIRRLVAAGP